jgi:hypothetical protein
MDRLSQEGPGGVYSPFRPARLTLTGAVRYERARFDDDLDTRRIDAGAGVVGYDARASSGWA